MNAPVDKIITISAARAKFSHINLRKEGKPGDGAKTAVDLKFSMAVENKILAFLCGADEPPPLWNADGSIKYKGIVDIPSKAKMMKATVTFGDLAQSKIELTECRVNKFRFTPISGHNIELSLRVQLNPDHDELNSLADAATTEQELYIECNLGPIGAVVYDDDDDSQGDMIDNT